MESVPSATREYEQGNIAVADQTCQGEKRKARQPLASDPNR